MVVYLIRHGQSEENTLDLRRRISMEDFAAAIRGTMNVPLTPTGIEQAQAAAAQLAPLGLTRLYASPFVRAQHTAQIIGAGTGLEIRTVEELREIMPIIPPVLRANQQRQFGALYIRGLIHQAIARRVREGETLWTAYRRVTKVWSAISAEWQPEDKIAIIAHRGFLGVLLRYLAWQPGWQVVRRNLSNAGISEVRRA
ncbi:MAG TPA: histidine phosphatase family protein [Herpetosiphonaceae bacterium]